MLDVVTGKKLSVALARNYSNANVTFTPDYQKVLIGPTIGDAPDIAVASTFAIFNGQDWQILFQGYLSPASFRMTNDYFAFQDGGRSYRYSFAKENWLSWPLGPMLNSPGVATDANKLVSEDLSAYFSPAQASSDNELNVGTLVHISDDNASCTSTSLTMGNVDYPNDGSTRFSLAGSPNLIVAERSYPQRDSDGDSVMKGLARVNNQ